MKFRRTSITRIRAGIGDVKIDPAWIKPRRKPLPAAPRSQQVGIDGEVKVSSGADVLEGDLLLESSTQTLMFVFQIQPDANSKVCLCLEVSTDVIKRQRAGQPDVQIDGAWFMLDLPGLKATLRPGAEWI